jgi:hypothetical protein
MNATNSFFGGVAVGLVPSIGAMIGFCVVFGGAKACCSTATFVITARAGPHGTITPSGKVDVAEGAGIAFTVRPDVGYAIDAVTVDGFHKGISDTYEFFAVRSNHTIGAAFTTPGTHAALYSFDFANGTPGLLTPESSARNNFAMRVVDDPLDASGKAVRFELRATDRAEDSQRSELKLHRSIWHAQTGSEYWYGFRILVPGSASESWTFGGDRWCAVAQWHDIPDYIDDPVRGQQEPWRAPPLALCIINDKWKIIYRFDPDQLSAVDGTWDKRSMGGCAPYDWQGQIDKPPARDGWWQASLKPDLGKWTSWVFHVKWSPDDKGLLDVWKDGEPVISRPNKPIGYNDVQGPTCKLGLYRSAPYPKAPYHGAYHDRVLYYGEYRIGDAKASYGAVAPRGASHAASSSR